MDCNDVWTVIFWAFLTENYGNWYLGSLYIETIGFRRSAQKKGFFILRNTLVVTDYVQIWIEGVFISGSPEAGFEPDVNIFFEQYLVSPSAWAATFNNLLVRLVSNQSICNSSIIIILIQYNTFSYLPGRFPLWPSFIFFFLKFSAGQRPSGCRMFTRYHYSEFTIKSLVLLSEHGT